MADWAKIDTNLFRHPQVVQLSPLEQLAFVRVILYCQELETDGVILDAALGAAQVTAKQMEAMQGTELVVRNGKGWSIPGFTKKQLTRDKLEEKRRQARERRERRAAGPA